jgi:hypothetical protein
MNPRCIVAGITNKVAKISAITPRRVMYRPTPGLVSVSTILYYPITKLPNVQPFRATMITSTTGK